MLIAFVVFEIQTLYYTYIYGFSGCFEFCGRGLTLDPYGVYMTFTFSCPTFIAFLKYASYTYYYIMYIKCNDAK